MSSGMGSTTCLFQIERTKKTVHTRLDPMELEPARAFVVNDLHSGVEAFGVSGGLQIQCQDCICIEVSSVEERQA
jgi:hypothetical protein